MLQQSYLLTKKKQINTTKCWRVRSACRSSAFSTQRQKILNCMQISRLNWFCKQKMVNGECSAGKLHVQEICTCSAPIFGHYIYALKYKNCIFFNFKLDVQQKKSNWETKVMITCQINKSFKYDLLIKFFFDLLIHNWFALLHKKFICASKS